ncbi:MAG: SPOR domain-containing protein [Deltaproteobacteria bacterium]|jgi:cell division protein FtsN|nr:SPOR domain-containing protein [Deltaproteobacteria bacterium]
MDFATPNSTGMKPPRFITLRLRLPVLIAALLLLLLGIIWIFIVGVIVGRGHNTQENIGILSKIIPGPPVEKSADNSIDAAGLPELRDSSAGETGQAEATNLDALFKDDNVLKGEALQFKDNLKSPYVPVPPATPPPGRAAASAAAPGNTVNAGASREPTYEYLFQVASLNRKNQADNLAQKLLAGGLESRVEPYKTSQKTWYRVMVIFKGRTTDLDAFRTRLKQFSINEAVLHKRTVLP